MPEGTDIFELHGQQGNTKLTDKILLDAVLNLMRVPGMIVEFYGQRGMLHDLEGKLRKRLNIMNIPPRTYETGTVFVSARMDRTPIASFTIRPEAIVWPKHRS